MREDTVVVESGTDDLLLGQLGDFTYNESLREWVFRRNIQHGELRLDIHKIVTHVHLAVHFMAAIPLAPMLEPSECFRQPRTDQRLSEMRKEVHSIVKKEASLAPATDLLIDCLETSAEGSTTGLEGADLIAFTKIRNPGSRTTSAGDTNILVVATGDAFNSVRFGRMESEGISLGEKSSTCLSSLTLGLGLEATFVGNGTPILQIISSGSLSEPGAFVAVRNHGSITITKPRILPTPTSCDTSRLRTPIKVTFPPSCLDPNPICEIGTKQGNGTSYVDCCFNPNSHEKFATLDAHGRWAIWTIEDASLESSGHLVTPGTHGQVWGAEHRGPWRPQDSWGKVLWTANDSMLTATRKEVQLHDVSTGRQVAMRTLEPESGSHLQLELKRSSVNDNTFFLLTSVHVLWLRIGAVEGPDPQSRTTTIETLLRWRHFRSPFDLGLRISVVPCGPGES